MKHKTLIVSSSIFCIFILMSTTNAIVVHEHLMTAQEPAADCTPPRPTNSFSVNDDRVYSWLLIGNVTFGDEIEWEFYAPGNVLYDTWRNVYALPENCACAWMWISGAPLGNWHVDVYVNGAYGFRENFTISKPLCTTELIYGEHSEEAELLRYTRDNILTKTPEGQEIIRLYYDWSPVIVKAMEENEEIKKEVKEMVDGILGLVGEGVE